MLRNNKHGRRVDTTGVFSSKQKQPDPNINTDNSAISVLSFKDLVDNFYDVKKKYSQYNIVKCKILIEDITRMQQSSNYRIEQVFYNNSNTTIMIGDQILAGVVFTKHIEKYLKDRMSNNLEITFELP